MSVSKTAVDKVTVGDTKSKLKTIRHEVAEASRERKSHFATLKWAYGRESIGKKVTAKTETSAETRETIKKDDSGCAGSV